jgi:very-short-patch-repair endonuclease
MIHFVSHVLPIMIDFFPVVLLPPDVRRVKAELPPLPPFHEMPPRMPSAKVQQLNVPLLVGLLTFVLVISITVIQSNSVIGLLVLTFGIFGVGFQAWVQGQTYTQRLKSNAQNLEHYYEVLEVYSRKEADYQAVVHHAQSPEQVRAYRYPRLLQVLGRTAPEDGQQEFVTLNPSENQFLHRLNHYFPGKVLPRTFFSPGGISPYVMDFAYIDSSTGLRIDIEIDEPFHPETFAPLHYLRDMRDQSWNDFLLDKGWCVIRFSINQMKYSPDSCCKAVAVLIDHVIEDKAILIPFQTIVDLEPHPRWTEQQAKAMLTQAQQPTT